MRKISLILVLSFILSLIYIPAVSAVDVDDYIYYNEFNSALSSEDELTLRPVNNGQDSIIVSTDDSSLMFRGDGSKTWTGSTYYAKLDLGTVENKPKLVYETKFKAEKYGSYTNISFRAGNAKDGYSQLFYINADREIYDKNGGTLITTISDITEWHTIHIIYDNEEKEGKYYRTILIDGVEYENSVAEGNTYGESGEFIVYPTAYLQTHATAGDRKVYYDYIKVYEYTDEFIADATIDESFLKADLDFSFDVKEGTLLKENISLVSEDLSHTVTVDTLTKKTNSQYELTLSEKLKFGTKYTVNISGVKCIMERSLSGMPKISVREAKAEVTDILISGSDNILSGDKTFDISYVNEKDIDFIGNIIYIQYKQDGTLISVSELPVTLDNKKEETKSIDVTLDVLADYMQVFLVNKDGTSFSDTYNFYKTGTKITEPLLIPENDINHTSNYVINETTGEVTVTVTADEDTTAFLNVKKGGEVIYALKANTTEKKAEFNFTPTEDGETYTYTYSVNKGVNDGSGEIVYYTPEYISVSFESFNGTEDTEVVKAFLEKFEKQLNLNLGTYNSYTNDAFKETVLKSVIAQRKLITPDKKYADAAALNVALQNAYSLVALRNGEKSIDDLKDNLNQDDYIYYKENMTKAVKNAVSSCFKETEILTIAEIEALFKDLMILKAIEKGENYKLTSGIIAKYHEYIGLDLSIYNTLKNAYKADTAIHGKAYGSLLLLKDAFDMAVANQKKAETVIIPQGGGGGGGSRPVIEFTPSDEKEPIEAVTPKPTVYFNDLGNVSWAEASINKLASKGVINGKADGKYAPNDTVTRAELVKMVIGAFDVELKTGNVNFTDMDASHWAYNFVVTACEKNLLKGMDEFTFGGETSVTREMAATVLYRVCQLKNISLNEIGKEFSDTEEISDYAKTAVSALSSNSVINGYEDGSFRPKGNVTRAEIAVLINNILK